MKRILFVTTIFISYFCISCTDTVKEAAKTKMLYMKDSNTNLCFGAPALFEADEKHGFDRRAMVCVPCDSLKNVTVYPLSK